LLLVICAGSLELVQLWVPGRDASVRDLVAGGLGAWIGILLVVAIRNAHDRIFIVME
jgi:VanZ family protein